VPPPRPRLAEPLAALSLAGDLGMGFPLEHALRVTYVAGRLAATIGLEPEQQTDAFYVALLHGIGCTADAHDLAAAFGADEIALKAAGALVDDADQLDGLRLVLSHAGTSGPALLRPVAVARALVRGNDAFGEGLRAHCEVGDLLASSVGVPESARPGLLALFDRWDGKGVRRVGGTDLPLAARVFHVAKAAVAHADRLGPGAALPAVRALSGRSLEPRLAEAFGDLTTAEPIVELLAEGDIRERVLDLEPPGSRQSLQPERERALFEAIGDMADIKAPSFVGHARGVASVAVDAGRRLGFTADELTLVERAALAHDLGRTGVPNTILDKPRPLTAAEWEVVRLHPYHGERVLLRSEVLAPYAGTVGLHHERLDGSGYHRGVPASSIPRPARLLAAADAWQAMRSARPYRPALSPQRAASALRADAAAGRLDRDAVEAAIAAAQGVPFRPLGAGRLSPREVEVLELLAAGLATREVAARLAITEKTVRHHVDHIFDKLGVSTRAAAVVAAIGAGRLRQPVDDAGRSRVVRSR
jgi:HD-GYP domain-containing protein (c-di-GMP phosphodiesterase class II)